VERGKVEITDGIRDGGICQRMRHVESRLQAIESHLKRGRYFDWSKDAEELNKPDWMAPPENTGMLDALQALYRVSSTTRERAAEIEKHYTRAAFVREFCIMRLSGPRRAGHTTAAIQFAAPFKKTLVVAPNWKAAGLYPKQFMQMSSRTLHSARGYRFDLIVLDPASHLECDNIVDELIPSLEEKGWFLLVG